MADQIRKSVSKAKDLALQGRRKSQKDNDSESSTSATPVKGAQSKPDDTIAARGSLSSRASLALRSSRSSNTSPRTSTDSMHSAPETSKRNMANNKQLATSDVYAPRDGAPFHSRTRRSLSVPQSENSSENSDADISRRNSSEAGNAKSSRAQSVASTRHQQHNMTPAEAALRKYLLRVTAGPSYDAATHKLVHVNSADSLHIASEHMDIRLKVRIRDYEGLPLSSPRSTAYFEDPLHAKNGDAYSIAFTFVPKHDIPSKDVVWGNDFDHPVRDRLPPGFNTAFRIVKQFVDPGLECDAYADEPWLYGPALSCWFVFRVEGLENEWGKSQDVKGKETKTTAASKKVVQAKETDIEEPEEKDDTFSDAPEHQHLSSLSVSSSSYAPDESTMPTPPDTGPLMHEGSSGSGAEVRTAHSLPSDPQKRRKHFLSASNRSSFVFEEGRAYTADFFNPYLDFNKFALRLPGFSLSVVKYIDNKSHSLRYVFKDRASGEVYLCVVLTLLFGDALGRALEAEKEGVEGGLRDVEVDTGAGER